MKLNDIYENIKDDTSGLLAIVRPTISKLLDAKEKSTDQEKSVLLRRISALLSKVVVDVMNVENPEEVRDVINHINAEIKNVGALNIPNQKLKDFQRRLEQSFYTL
jgi:hypothetical protein